MRKIGYSLGPLLSFDELLRCAVLADSWSREDSVDSIWVPESWGREAFSTLGAIAKTSNKIRLGTSIISIFSRTPATIAMGAVTLDMISNNRTVVGLGTSTEAIVENWHGTKFEKPASRMREYIDCIRLMTSGERVTYSGKFFRISNFKMLNPPPRKNVPIFIAAINKNMLALASEKADGVLFYLRPLEEISQAVASMRRISAATNTSKKQFEVALSLICAISDKEPEKARFRAAKTLAFYIAVGKYYSKFLAENGYHNEVAEITTEYQLNGGEAAARMVPVKMLDALTICGTKEQCRKSLSRFLDAGITLPILQFNPVGDTESSFRELLSTFH